MTKEIITITIKAHIYSVLFASLIYYLLTKTHRNIEGVVCEACVISEVTKSKFSI